MEPAGASADLSEMRLRRRLWRTIDVRSEAGIVLVMTIAILLFLTIVVAAVSTLTSSVQTTAATGTAQQNAYALAETGLNNALSALEDTPTNDPENPNLLGSPASPIVTTASTGTVAWYGVFNASTNVWTITSTSTIASPVGGGIPIHTTLTRQVTITATLNGNWNRIYQEDASTCLVVPDKVNIPSNITAQGPLCLTGGTITGSTTIVTAGSTVTLTAVAAAATSATLRAGAGAGWTNPQNIGAQDNVVATATIGAKSDGPVLTASNFGFTIPSGSTINGITVTFVRWASANSPGCCIQASHVYLAKGGVAGGTDHASNTYWPNAGPGGGGPGSSVTFGSNADLWGQTWAAADVDSSSFGVQFSTHNYGNSSVTGSVDYVAITIAYSPPGDDASIGLSGLPVQEADLGGTCNYNSQGAHTPCGIADHVWGSSVSTKPQGLTKPGVNYPYWYTNAAPGPMHGCTVKSGTPPVFDANPPNYDNSVGMQKIAGVNVASYTCIAEDANGNVVGQLSWNQGMQVLTISGVVFIDGEADFGSGPGTSVIHYQGRGAIYAPGGSHIDVPVCAGGTGAVSCETTGMSNWDPSQNLLVLVVGDKKPAGNNDCKIDEVSSAFQGVYWSKNTCDMAAGAEISGPIIANDLAISDGHVSAQYPATLFYPWPSLGTILPGVSAGAGAYTFTLGPESIVS